MFNRWENNFIHFLDYYNFSNNFANSQKDSFQFILLVSVFASLYMISIFAIGYLLYFCNRPNQKINYKIIKIATIIFAFVIFFLGDVLWKSFYIETKTFNIKYFLVTISCFNYFQLSIGLSLILGNWKIVNNLLRIGYFLPIVILGASILNNFNILNEVFNPIYFIILLIIILNDLFIFIPVGILVSKLFGPKKLLKFWFLIIMFFSINILSKFSLAIPYFENIKNRPFSKLITSILFIIIPTQILITIIVFVEILKIMHVLNQKMVVELDKNSFLIMLNQTLNFANLNFSPKSLAEGYQLHLRN
ncbi:hypothetical protein [Spiroplasma chrysopicola]|uniref:Transmembrane protein n=1 Tax=Spiroplasma chrysopicola DF-1 TaxID=1276227 RepID=R4U1M8_9MOLU|nr:hypothetical protein [Spiroplasma chrysopicola]AGM25217.1 hypothetical protein SCHRY_v1c06410 [Spiroplasma chrysopicola DF-1]